MPKILTHGKTDRGSILLDVLVSITLISLVTLPFYMTFSKLLISERKLLEQQNSYFQKLGQEPHWYYNDEKKPEN